MHVMTVKKNIQQALILKDLFLKGTKMITKLLRFVKTVKNIIVHATLNLPRTSWNWLCSWSSMKWFIPKRFIYWCAVRVAYTYTRRHKNVNPNNDRAIMKMLDYYWKGYKLGKKK